MSQKKFILKYDEFFKITTKNFFEILKCNVITEFEIINLPKKVDIIIIKNPNSKKLQLFKYFKNYNIISFKSEKDKPTSKDFYDLFIYLMGFCNLEKLANLNNTTITLIASHLPKSFLKLFQHNLIPIKKGLWKLEQKLFHIYFIEINQLDSKDYEVEYLYIFGNKEKLTTGSHNIHNLIKNKKMLEFLKKMYFIRYSNFEKEIPEDFPMPKVYEADITELVKPHYEKGLQEGLQQGLKEGLQKGLQEGKLEGKLEAKIETAKKMKKKGYSIKDICEITGVSKKDLKKYKII
jgi:hypothetical protein